MPDYIQRSLIHNVQEIMPSLWQIQFLFPTSTNCWLFKDRDGLTLIDSGHHWSMPQILAAIKLLGIPLTRIIITHAHPDHAGSASKLSQETGAAVLAHSADIPYLNGERSMATEPGFWLCRAVLAAVEKLGANSPPIDQVQALQDNEMIGSLQVIHTPGHTPGSISLWAENEKALFCGDNLLFSLNAVRVGLPLFTLDRATQNKSMQRYLDLPARFLLSGHGPVYGANLAEALKDLLS